MRCATTPRSPPTSQRATSNDRLPGSARAHLASKWGEALTLGVRGAAARSSHGAPNLGTKRGPMRSTLQAASREKENEDPVHNDGLRNRSPRKNTPRLPSSPASKSRSPSARPPASPLSQTRSARPPASPLSQTRQLRQPLASSPTRRRESSDAASSSPNRRKDTSATHAAPGQPSRSCACDVRFGYGTPRQHLWPSPACAPHTSGPSLARSRGQGGIVSMGSKASGSGLRCGSPRGTLASSPHSRYRDISPSSARGLQAQKPAWRVGVPHVPHAYASPLNSAN